MESIVCNGIGKIYGKKQVLKNINLTLEKGKIYGLIGRNGAGKTTLLSIMSAQNPASEGTVTWNGENVWENRKALDHICFSRELSINLYGSGVSGMKVKDYLKTASYYYPDWDQALAEELIKKFELNTKQRINKMSKGMLSMVTIIVALASKADFTFMDEPVAGLDVVMRDYFYHKLMEEYTETGRTFVISTHIIEEATDLMEEVVMIKNGEVLLKENTQELLERSYHVSGLAEVVDQATEGYERHHEEKMGRSKSVTILLKEGQKLPEGFQRAEFLLEHGFVDMILPRQDQKHVIGRILYMHRKHDMAVEKDAVKADTAVNVSEARQKKENTEKSAWDTVLLSRKADRPTALDYINAVFDEFIEFHGDRCFKDDGAIVGGIAMFHGMPVTVIGQQKGKNTKDNIRRNFGMPSPDGYRKALRLMKQAETFGRPIICFVDTPGAFCGLEAEERGQGEAIARNLMEMSGLTVPVIAVVTGEGSSGGALALGVANHILMLENAVYSVLSPEGFASILWKDASRSGEACEMMKLTAQDLYSDGIVEQVIPEPLGGAQRSHAALFEQLDVALRVHLKELCRMSGRQLADQRYKKYRQIGETRNA